MSVKCNNCGNIQDDNALFCSMCGSKIEITKANEEQGNVFVNTETNNEPCTQCTNTDADENSINSEPINDSQNCYPPKNDYVNYENNQSYDSYYAQQYDKPLNTVAYFGLKFLYKIPVLGLLFSLIFSFAPKNDNLNNYSRAVVIWKLIAVLLIVLLFALVLFSGSWNEIVRIYKTIPNT